MYIEGVIICVGYSDFLAHTLPHNKQHFNRLVVVTDTKDEQTRALCEFHHVECIQTDVFYEDNEKFNKGKGINVGLKTLSLNDWVIHIDADIYLPPLTRHILERISLDPKNIYGIDRMMCPNYVEWQKFLLNPKTHEGWIYVHPTAFPIGVRIAEYMSEGWEPIGFFQMWHPKESGVFEYPPYHGAADRTDVLHAKKFPRNKRQLIPEIIGIHLDSENLNLKDMGKNWNGRQTLPFTYEYSLLATAENIKKDVENIVEEIDEKVEEKIDIYKEKDMCKKGYNLPWYLRAWYVIKDFIKKHHHLLFLVFLAILSILTILKMK